MKTKKKIRIKQDQIEMKQSFISVYQYITYTFYVSHSYVD